MSKTKVYGASDDLIEFEGELRGEVNHNTSETQERGSLIVMSDGTVLEVCYSKSARPGIWSVTPLKQGPLFEVVTFCNEDKEEYSDVAHFSTGIKWAFACEPGKWESVR